MWQTAVRRSFVGARCVSLPVRACLCALSVLGVCGGIVVNVIIIAVVCVIPPCPACLCIGVFTVLLFAADCNVVLLFPACGRTILRSDVISCRGLVEFQSVVVHLPVLMYS